MYLAEILALLLDPSQPKTADMKQLCIMQVAISDCLFNEGCLFHKYVVSYAVCTSDLSPLSSYAVLSAQFTCSDFQPFEASMEG